MGGEFHHIAHHICSCFWYGYSVALVMLLHDPHIPSFFRGVAWPSVMQFIVHYDSDPQWCHLGCIVVHWVEYICLIVEFWM